jgi:dihydroflavonol-4-reductase
MTYRSMVDRPMADIWQAGAFGTVAVTGATGFIGAHLVARLVRGGERVRVLMRDRTKLASLAGLDVEPVELDLLDRLAVQQALAGCGLVFHVAGEIGGRARERIWAINAAVPAMLVEIAAMTGVRRVVVTSTASAVGPAPGDELTTEDSPYQSLGFVYMDSKQAGEAAALEAGQRLGVDVVVTNPTYCLGAALNPSVRGAPSTRLVGNYVRRRLPAIIDAYNNFVDVEDVADGHLLAAQFGKPGQRYLLGSENLSWAAFLRLLREVRDVRQPVIVLPRGLERLADRPRLMGLPNPLPREPIRLMARDWRYSSDKAIAELGYTPSPIRNSVARTIEWYERLIAEGRLTRRRAPVADLLGGGLRVAGRLRLTGVLAAAGIRII